MPSAPAAEIAQDELAAFREWQRQQEEAKAKASTSSPPKNQKTEDEEDMIEFEAKLVDLDINFADPEVQPKLRSSKRSRRDFFWLSTKKRDFGSAAECAIPNIAAEENAHQAMLLQVSFPHRISCTFCCDQFYKMVQHEFAMAQYTLERHTSQLNALERAKANNTILILDLPPIYNKETVDTDMAFYLQLTNMSWNTPKGDDPKTFDEDPYDCH